MLRFVAAGAVTAQAVNPIQKVLELLGDIKGKVQKEGETEAAQFDEYSKWCTAEARDTEHAIDTGNSKSDALNAEIQEQGAIVGESNSEIAELSGAIAANEKDLSGATKIRESEAKDFAATEKDLVDTIDTLVRAGSVLRKAGLNGSAGSAAQLRAALTQVSGTMSVLLDAAHISMADKAKLASLVQAGEEESDGPSGAPEAAAYESHSTGILDTLAELKVKAEQELADLRKEESNKKHNYEMLRQGLVDQMNTQESDMKKTKASLSAASESKANAEGDLAATTKLLNEKTAYLSDTKTSCNIKAEEWEERQKSRVEELAAVEKAIEILSAEDVTAATGRRLPSFVQVSTKDNVRQEVAALLQDAAKRLNSIGLAQLAIRTRSGDDPFAKVKGLIQGMIEKLTTQAAEEADHNAYCNEENKKSKTKRDELSAKVDNVGSRIDKAETGVATLKEEIANLSSELAEMAKSNAEATKIRQEESAAYKAAMEDYAVSQTALQNAIEVLQAQFSGAAFLQAAPEVFSGGYEKKSDAAGGIIGLLEVALSDFARMEAEGKASEASAVKAFAKLMQDSEVQKATMTTAVKSKEGEVTRVTALVADLKNDREGTQSELDAVLTYIEKLKESCEHKPMSFEERAARRKQEIESLKNALDILENETATSFLQRRD